MTGMDRWIDWSRDDFIGHEAAAKERSEGNVGQRLVTLEIDADDADASGYEPIWQNDKRVGFVDVRRLWTPYCQEPRNGPARCRR